MTSNLIVSDPKIMLGKPCIRGTRITVELILEKLAAGEKVEAIVAAHPKLSVNGVLAAIDYARQVLRSDIILPVTEDVT